MSGDDGNDRRIDGLFDQHIRYNTSLSNISVLGAVLPDDPDLLRGLAARCLREGRKAMHAGHHLEGRRLDILGHQLIKRARESTKQD